MIDGEICIVGILVINGKVVIVSFLTLSSRKLFGTSCWPIRYSKTAKGKSFKFIFTIAIITSLVNSVEPKESSICTKTFLRNFYRIFSRMFSRNCSRGCSRNSLKYSSNHLEVLLDTPSDIIEGIHPSQSV